ncbi:MAG: lysophospholipid acyltransferase family protein [Candidatus Omnitrophica bacterium]|nr:lysophospholipid acyltransferase family protein [Candidatus Omnitrophota bacterium]MDD5355704.1 lysophospholipid acyltransferase family protein [Candidatus Omnitrophota bacterium]
MWLKKVYKETGRFIGRLAIRVCLFLIKITPKKYIYTLAHFIAKLSFLVLFRHRRIAFDGLRIAFGKEKSEKEIKQIAVDSFETMAKIAIEFMVFLDNPDFLNRYVKIEGLENLDKALAKGKGVVALSAHFGNFPLMIVNISRQGYKVSAVMRHMRDQWTDKYFETKRHVWGVKSIYTQPRKQCVDEILEALRDNKVVFIQLDQNFGSGGIFVDFFGRKAATAKGPIVFALRTKAAIVPMFMYRENDNTHKLIIEPEAEIAQGKDFEETVHLTAQKLTDIIESYVRRYPHEWGWIHKRWKARPQEERGL